jgi:hypothetical protein
MEVPYIPSAKPTNKIMDWTWWLKVDPISKITNTNRTGRVAQVVECLLSKTKTLSSNPQYHQKNRIE